VKSIPDLKAKSLALNYVGEFRSGARTNCQFSLCAVANRLPKRSATKLGSYPNPPVGVTFTGGPNAAPCERQNGTTRRIVSVPTTGSVQRLRLEKADIVDVLQGEMGAEAEWPLRDAVILERVAPPSERAKKDRG